MAWGLGWLELGWLVRGRTALSPMHSLSRAQFVQSGRLSLQMPADTIVTDRARANSFIIVGVFRRDKLTAQPRASGGRRGGIIVPAHIACYSWLPNQTDRIVVSYTILSHLI